MNRMKQILCTALISLFILLLFGCHAKEEPDYTKGDAAEFVKNAARAITNRMAVRFFISFILIIPPALIPVNPGRSFRCPWY